MPPELFAKLASTQVDPHRPVQPSETLRFLNGATGIEIGAAVIPHLYRMQRSKLRALLGEGISIQYDKTLSTISYTEDGSTVTAHFEDGTTASGTILIGADGTRSKVRNLLLGEEKAALDRLEYAALWVQAKYTAEQVKYLRSGHPLFLACCHPLGYFGWLGTHSAPDQDVPEEWVMNCYISYKEPIAEQEKCKKWPNERTLGEVKALAEMCFAEPFKSAFGWLGDEQEVWYSPLTQWDPSLPEHQWDNHSGRVTLAGDAAHPMTYQRGQGANFAIKDSLELVNHIVSVLYSETKGRKEAVGVYEQEMKERAGEEVRLSYQNTEMVHVWEKVLQSPVMKHGLNPTS
ncbi:hypothetical protein HYFRA_00010106 [Hymenoscyphus fraxineus]|uniref:FAD-binding domain-containing protein n=1 Tax=Hymenoscyphus fraxineus TaxID=746836 RepID=A0A9N9PTL9_9HELO|nr:hypothetical protein HYFRA_00010106 [Hymenoscyphus fraxineus]